MFNFLRLQATLPEPDEILPEPGEILPEPESVNPPANAREIDESRWRRGFDPDYRKGGGKFVGKGVILHGPALAAYAGLETTFLFPILSPASTYATTIDALETVQVDQNDATIDSNLFMSPRVWIGLQHGTWGMEARYFRMGASKHEFFPQSPLVPRNIRPWNDSVPGILTLRYSRSGLRISAMTDVYRLASAMRRLMSPTKLAWTMLLLEILRSDPHWQRVRWKDLV